MRNRQGQMESGLHQCLRLESKSAGFLEDHVQFRSSSCPNSGCSQFIQEFGSQYGIEPELGLYIRMTAALAAAFGRNALITFYSFISQPYTAKEITEHMCIPRTKFPFTLISKPLYHSLISDLARGPISERQPTFAINTSIFPKSTLIDLKAESTATSSTISATYVKNFVPVNSLASVVLVSRRVFQVQPMREIVAEPETANERAISGPSPKPPPVITTLLPLVESLSKDRSMTRQESVQNPTMSKGQPVTSIISKQTIDQMIMLFRFEVRSLLMRQSLPSTIYQ